MPRKASVTLTDWRNGIISSINDRLWRLTDVMLCGEMSDRHRKASSVFVGEFLGPTAYYRCHCDDEVQCFHVEDTVGLLDLWPSPSVLADTSLCRDHTRP